MQFYLVLILIHFHFQKLFSNNDNNYKKKYFFNKIKQNFSKTLN